MFRTEQINKIFDEKALESFWAIVKTGRLTDAAAMLEVTQPAISAAIKKIENKIDRPLLKRGGYKKIELTDEGKKLFLFADKHFSTLASKTLHKHDLVASKRRVGISNLLPAAFSSRIVKNIAEHNKRHHDVLIIEYDIIETVSVTSGFNEGVYDCIYTPYFEKDVSLALDAHVHITGYTQRFKTYIVDPRDTVTDKTFGHISLDNFSLLSVLPSGLSDVYVYHNEHQLIENISEGINYVVLNDQQAQQVKEHQCSLEVLDDDHAIEVKFGFCVKSGEEALAQICNQQITLKN